MPIIGSFMLYAILCITHNFLRKRHKAGHNIYKFLSFLGTHSKCHVKRTVPYYQEEVLSKQNRNQTRPCDV